MLNPTAYGATGTAYGVIRYRYYALLAGKVDQFGSRFSVDIPVTGPNGNTVAVRSAWIYESGSTNPRLTSVYVK